GGAVRGGAAPLWDGGLRLRDDEEQRAGDRAPDRRRIDPSRVRGVERGDVGSVEVGGPGGGEGAVALGRAAGAGADHGGELALGAGGAGGAPVAWDLGLGETDADHPLGPALVASAVERAARSSACGEASQDAGHGAAEARADAQPDVP